MDSDKLQHYLHFLTQLPCKRRDIKIENYPLFMICFPKFTIKEVKWCKDSRKLHLQSQVSSSARVPHTELMQVPKPDNYDYYHSVAFTMTASCHLPG